MLSISRKIAYEALIEWEGSFADPHLILNRALHSDIAPSDRAFSRELLFGTIKYRRQLDFYIDHFIKQGNLDDRLRPVLRMGFYQLLHTPNIPDYAVVSETVELANKFHNQNKAGFINAILRKYLKDKSQVKLPDFGSQPVEFLGLNYSFPEWIVKRYIDRYGINQTASLLRLFNRPPVFSFFINTRQYNFDETMRKIDDMQIAIGEHREFPGYFYSSQSSTLLRSDLFKQGRIVIGDPAQSLAVRSIDGGYNGIVLDLFASPGGKTAAICSKLGPNGLVIASDKSWTRTKLLNENVIRWRLDNALVICSDAFTFASKRKFRYILADVPCSGTGTFRRNPDLRWNITSNDIERLANQQLSLLECIKEIIEPGGTIVYSTCSLEPEENSQVIENFLKQNEDFAIQKIDALAGFKTENDFYEVLPYYNDGDGSFMAVLKRTE